MKKIINRFLLEQDEFMPKICLTQLLFTYSACKPFTKNKEIIQQFNETGDQIYISQNEQYKACFWHNMAYQDFKNLTRWTASDKRLCDKTFNIAKSP